MGDSGQTGIALLCDSKGGILEIVRDDLGLAGPAAPGRLFSALMDPGSFQKSLHFIRTVETERAAFDWQMDVVTRAGPQSLFFCGTLSEADRMIVLGATTLSGVVEFQNEVMRMNNEHVNALRSSAKDSQIERRALFMEGHSLFNELSRLNGELANVQRDLIKNNVQLAGLNEEKTRFLGMATYDLRGPIGIIRTYSDFLLEGAAAVLSPEQLAFISIIRNSSRSMLRLIDDLLDDSPIDSGNLRLEIAPCDLVALAGANLALNATLAGQRGVSIRLEKEADLPSIGADAAKIEQVLNHLVGNAIRFSPRGGAIEVGLARREEGLLLTVRDHGPGIPEADREKLFKPFQGTSVTGGGERGAGLGLAIVKRIVDGHQGKIWAESTAGRGSTFFVLLPWTAGETPAPGFPAGR